MVKIYYSSDLHLDFNKEIDNRLFEKINDNDSYLILAGDLCEIREQNYKLIYNFFDIITLKFKNIIYISGNHEYHNSILSDNKIKEVISKYNNIYFLQNNFKEFEEDKVLFYGTTLWTDSSGDKLRDKYVESIMYDYRYIYKNNNNLLTREDTILLHRYNRNRLFDFLEDIKIEDKYTIIIISHHLPLLELIHENYKDNLANSAYASNLKEELKKYNFDYWISGHTHKTVNYELKLNNDKVAKFYVNPRGYNNDNKLYDEYKFIEA